MRWPMNLLVYGRPLQARQFGKGNGFFRARRFVDCFHNANIGQTFEPGRFRRFIFEYAIREVNQQGGKLIPPRKCPGFAFFSPGQLMFERPCILIGRIGPKHALGSNEGVTANIGSTKTACKGSETVFRKAHHYRGHFLYALEALIPIVASYSENLRWF